MRVLLAVVLSLLAALPARSADLTVFAAASMTEVVQGLSKTFETRHGVDVTTIFAASSTLARQIERGAPADIFISANRAWMDHLDNAGALQVGSRRVIARNTLVLAGRAGDQGVSQSPDFILSEASQARIAVGDPAHVPAGLYTRQALTSLDRWQIVKPRLVPAANTRAAITFLQRGAAPYAIAYRTDVLAFPDLLEISAFATNSHDPISYEAAATLQGSATPLSAAYLDFLASEKAATLIRHFGFVAVSAK